jgi:leader peptidase (prepilin peptidase)/N-methyltransferase
MLLTLPLAAWVVLAAVLGAMLGAGLQRVIHRWPRQMMHRWHLECEAFLAEHTVVGGTASSHKVSATGVSKRWPLVQGLTAVLWAAVTLVHGLQPTTLAYAALLAGLVVLCFIDAKHMFLPDELTLGLLWLGLLLSAVGVLPLSLQDAVWGGALGYCLLAVCAGLFARFTGRQGMGHGDFKLLAALGAWFGVWSLLPLVLMSSVSAVVWTLLLRLWRARTVKRTDKPLTDLYVVEDQHFAFGPFLGLAGAVLVLWPLSYTSAWGSLLQLNV